MHAVPLEETVLCDAIVDGAAKVQLQFGWPAQGRGRCQIQQASGFSD